MSAGQGADPLHDDSAKAAKETAQLAALSRVVQQQQDTISRQVSPRLAGQHVTGASASMLRNAALHSSAFCTLMKAAVTCGCCSSHRCPASNQVLAEPSNNSC
jgi:predicted phage tail protein